MMNIKCCLGFLIIINILFSWPTVALATSRDILSTTIPASACQPDSSAASGRVSLTNGAYVFSGNATGTVRFYCPLPVSRYTSNGLANDNDISSYHVYYRDPDGLANSSEITTRLFYRNVNGQTAVGSASSSNSFNVTGNTARIVRLNHNLGFERLYYFLVTIRRSSTELRPAFSGIDFEIPPPS